MVLAYRREEEQYLPIIKAVPRSQLPPDANVISSHVLYELKPNDDASLKLKARIAPHGNEDSDTLQLRITCVMCPPLGIRIIVTVCDTHKWKIKHIDVKVSFYQSSAASRQVFVRPPRESVYRGVLWFLLVAGYGLVNAGAKWPRRSDDAFRELGLQSITVMPQFFARFVHGKLVLLAIKIVDDISLAGEDDQLEWFEVEFGNIFELSESECGPGRLCFFGLNIEQADDYSCTMHADDKLNALEAYPLARVCRRQLNQKMNQIELADFRSLNSSICRLGTVSSPLCAFYASSLQQLLPSSTVHDLDTQQNALKLLKRHGTLTSYPRPAAGSKLAVNLVAFADASHRDDLSQLSYIIGLVFGEVQQIASSTSCPGPLINRGGQFTRPPPLGFWLQAKPSMR